MNISRFYFTVIVFTTILFYACKDKTNDPAPDIIDSCSSKNITLTATPTAANACMDNGKLVARAGGSTGFTFQLNNGAFQVDSNFNNLASGTYKITTKDLDGCSKAATFTITSNNTKGPKFTEVSAIIVANCQGGFCHATGSGNAPVNIMDNDCEIVTLGPTIKTKSVDGSMGNLSTTDKNKITAWLNAGGRFID